MPEHGVNATGLRFHTPQKDADAEKHSRESNLEAASKTLILNFEGHKGSGDSAYIEVDGKKMKVKDVSVWIDKLDTNKDGVVSKEELQKGGGDKLGILKLDASKEEQQKISKEMREEQLLGGIKGMQKGLEQDGAISWGIARRIINNNTDKAGLKYMLSTPAIKSYIDKNIKTDKTLNSHFKTILEDAGFTPDEIKKYGF